LGNLKQPWATLGYFGYPGLPWATLGYLGLLWATLGYLGLPWATLGYLGLPWATLGYLGLPWATMGALVLPLATLGHLWLHWLSWATGSGLPEYLYWVSHQHCPSTYTGFYHCYLLRYRSWRKAPRLLRSNIPRSALCATLDTYNVFFENQKKSFVH
jgi:hypothetical protein